MKKLTLLLALCLSLFVGCDQNHHARPKRHTQKKSVQVHHTPNHEYLYHDDDSDTWYELYLFDNTTRAASEPYRGSLSDYRSAGATWRAVPAAQVPKEVIAEEENPSLEPEAAEVDENMDAAAVETVEIDVADNGVPVDPASDLASDGTYDSSSYESSDTTDTSVDTSSDFSSDSSSFDSSSPD